MNYNPVRVIETNNWKHEYNKLMKKVGVHKPLIITSKGNLKRQKLLTVFDSKSVFSNVIENPTFQYCQNAIDYRKKGKFNSVIAIGGGSVMDTAKTVMASIGTGINSISDLIKNDTPYNSKVPSIFIPTTHGSGSEVTMWGTVWDMKEKKKYSISHPYLYPNFAILDGSLTLSLPLNISLTSILDALSHSFEAIWNKNANKVSTEYAIEAICLILKNVNRFKKREKDLYLRKLFLKASNIAGLAFSRTKTAAAHSISYPLTINYGIPHGIASSLPLLQLLRINEREIKNELSIILFNLGIKDLNSLINLIQQIPDGIIKYSLKDWGVKRKDINGLVTQSYTKGRMENNIVDLLEKDIYQIYKEIY